jgi:transposase-like protein
MAKRRNIQPQEKLAIVLEGMSSDSGIAEVCRRRGITTTQYYTWRQQLMRSADAIYGRHRKGSRQEEHLAEQQRRMQAVIAEITAENLELKKTFGG